MLGTFQEPGSQARKRVVPLLSHLQKSTDEVGRADTRGSKLAKSTKDASRNHKTGVGFFKSDALKSCDVRSSKQQSTINALCNSVFHSGMNSNQLPTDREDEALAPVNEALPAQPKTFIRVDASNVINQP